MNDVSEKLGAVQASQVAILREVKDARDEMRRTLRAHERRINVVEDRSAKSARDIGWIKRIGAAAWAALAGYIHFGK